MRACYERHRERLGGGRYDAYMSEPFNNARLATVSTYRRWVPAFAAMHEAAQTLVGKHDFSTFRATLCQAKSPVKTLTSLSVERREDYISIRARAPSFLHHQVRNIVGTLKLVGEGKWTAADVSAALAACDRTRGGPTAPAHGLYLTEVVYPETIR